MYFAYYNYMYMYLYVLHVYVGTSLTCIFMCNNYYLWKYMHMYNLLNFMCCRSLQDLLRFEGDVESTFCLMFEVRTFLYVGIHIIYDNFTMMWQCKTSYLKKWRVLYRVLHWQIIVYTCSTRASERNLEKGARFLIYSVFHS